MIRFLYVYCGFLVQLGICFLFDGQLPFNESLIHSKDEDADLNTPQLIESRGFKAEVHYVTTEDGYILTVHRIVCPHEKLGRPYILQHGFESSSSDWVINSPGIGTENSDTYFNNIKVSNNLGFDMCLRGYDVWLPNTRGNLYSVNHTTLDPKDKKFWEFSIDELVKYDLPAVIAYILDVTKHATLGYIGHSQGTRIILCLLAEKPTYSNEVVPVVLLAPIARIDHMKSPLKYIATWPVPDILRSMGGSFLLPPNFENELSKKVCRLAGIDVVLCSSLMFLYVGRDQEQLNQTRLQVYTAHFPAGASLWNFAHFLQNYNSKSLAKFDYGIYGNLEKYKSTAPPEYNLKNIISPNIIMISSVNDFLSNPTDVQWIRDQLEVKLHCDVVVDNGKWNHADYVYGLQSAKYVHYDLLKCIAPFDSH